MLCCSLLHGLITNVESVLDLQVSSHCRNKACGRFRCEVKALSRQFRLDGLMHSAKKQKVASFYSKSLPRPTVLLDNENKPIRDRVDPPEPVTAALLGKHVTKCRPGVKNLAELELLTTEWAKHAPMNKGGSKPVFKGAPSACLTAFGAMVSPSMDPYKGQVCKTPLLHALC